MEEDSSSSSRLQQHQNHEATAVYHPCFFLQALAHILRCLGFHQLIKSQEKKNKEDDHHINTTPPEAFSSSSSSTSQSTADPPTTSTPPHDLAANPSTIMNKQDVMKLQQSCVLKVNIDCHCDGCKNKVKKLLQKIDGVYKTAIDAEQGKVTVTGNVDPAILIRKLEKSGKHAELWGPQKGSINNQFKNLSFDNGNKAANKSQKAGNNQPKSGGQQQQLLQQQMMQQILKGSNKDMKMPHKEQKSVKFNLPEDDFDDEDGEFDDDFDDEDEEFDDEEVGHGHHQLPKPNKNNGHGLHGPDMNVKKGGGGKKGGAMGIPIVMMGEKDNNGGKKQDKGAREKISGGFFGFGKKKWGESKNSEKSSGGGLLGFGKKSKDKEDFTHKNGNKNGKNGSGSGAGGNHNGNGSKKGGPKNDGAPQMRKVKNESDTDFGGMGNSNGRSHGNISGGGGGKNMGPMGQMGYMGQMPMANHPMGPMANHPMGPVGGVPAVQGMNGGVGGYYQGMGPAGYPYDNQQHHMMNQHPQMNGNGMYQPMMYERPHPAAVNYGGPTHASDNYPHYFSDESTDSCSIM
ncbi:hypothetical protein ACOSP7_009422 [Xanthoceras sorbifolium]